MPSVLCVPTDREDPAIRALPADVRRIIERITIGPGYTETECGDCRRSVAIGPIQRTRATAPGARIICYVCADPATIAAYVSNLPA